VSETLPKFQQVQYQFTRHMRDPENNPSFDEIEDRRTKVYADLLFNNVQGFLANSFPVLSSLMDDNEWLAMVRDYFKRHQARTPLFPKMPQEFLHYLADEYEPTENVLPFIHELAHYEWLELETLLDGQEIDSVEIDEEMNVLDGTPVLNPLARPQVYQFPVHRISKEYIPSAPPQTPTYLVVYRDRSDDVGFMEINPTTGRLIELISAGAPRKSGRELLEQIAIEMGHESPEVVVAGGLSIMQELLKRDVLLGATAV
jgi:hypothetical protein